MNNLDIWTLIQNGNFEEACEQADVEYRTTKRLFPLRNKLLALMLLKQYEKAIVLCNELIIHDGEASSDFIICGIAHWAKGQNDEAIAMWLQAEKTKYTDASGGVGLLLILYFASVRLQRTKLREETLKKLQKSMRGKAAVNWPGALGPFILEQSSSPELLASVTLTPILRERQSCQVYFAIAVKELERGNLTQYYSNLNVAINYGPSAYLEQVFYLAQFEVQDNR